MTIWYAFHCKTDTKTSTCTRICCKRAVLSCSCFPWSRFKTPQWKMAWCTSNYPSLTSIPMNCVIVCHELSRRCMRPSWKYPESLTYTAMEVGPSMSRSHCLQYWCPGSHSSAKREWKRWTESTLESCRTESLNSWDTRLSVVDRWIAPGGYKCEQW